MRLNDSGLLHLYFSRHGSESKCQLHFFSLITEVILLSLHTHLICKLGEAYSPSLNIFSEPWSRQPVCIVSFLLSSLLPPSVSIKYIFEKVSESATNSEKKMEIALDLFIRQTLLKDYTKVWTKGTNFKTLSKATHYTWWFDNSLVTDTTLNVFFIIL